MKEIYFLGGATMSEKELEFDENEEKSLMEEYGEVVVNSLITSFGLDIFIKDRHGGDVDTVHNVREIGRDPMMEYKNENNADAYNNRGTYSNKDYHKGTNFQKIKHEARKQYQENFEPIKDEYTGKENLGFLGKSGPSDRNAELDHVKEAEQIHNDRGRVLAGLDGKELADDEENFAWTNKSLNASMGAWAHQKNERWKKEHNGENAPMSELDMKAYIKDHPDLDETTKKNMLAQYEKSNRAYESKLNKYYTSKEFWQDTGTAALKTGIAMGARQVVGLVFTEIWFTVVEKIENCNGEPSDYFNAVGEGLKEGYENALKKFDTYIKKFLEGSVSGALSSLVTTLINIFFTTAKNVVKIIRELFSSLMQTARILVFNPEKYPDAIKKHEALKILSAGLGVIAGTLTKEALEDSPIGKLGKLGEVISTFCELLVSGILTCSFIRIINTLLKKSINFQLATYYFSKQENIDSLFANDQNLQAPFLLEINERRYKKSQYKIMFVSDNYYDLVSYDKEKGIQPILDCYNDWEISHDDFWLFSEKLNMELNPEWCEKTDAFEKVNDLNFVWNNFSKILPIENDYSKRKIQKSEIENFNVLQKEIKILCPDVIIFCTKKSMDKFIFKKFSGKTKIKSTSFFNFRFLKFNLARVKNSNLPKHTYRIRPSKISKDAYFERLVYLITGKKIVTEKKKKEKKTFAFKLPKKPLAFLATVIVLVLFLLLLRNCQSCSIQRQPVDIESAPMKIQDEPQPVVTKIVLEEQKSAYFIRDSKEFEDYKQAQEWFEFMAVEIKKCLEENPNIRFKAKGCIAEFDNDVDGAALSMARAEVVVNGLVAHGVPRNVLKIFEANEDNVKEYTNHWGAIDRRENRAAVVYSVE